MRKVDVKEKARDRELRVLNQWKQDDTFRKSIDNRVGKPNFVFYEGPPTANGQPHIGHVLGRVIKDFIGRYKTMSGYRVVRKAGWDTHGLPVELGVQKQLGISGKQEIEDYGVAKFVEQCKSSVFEYEKQWRELTEGIAYWTDMDDPYVTLTNNYIESVWHILSEIHKKELLYKGHRVSPYCPDCQTTLSSHEVAQGYEDVKDLSATVKFKSKNGNEIFLAWTTTPWTLPANVALAINKHIDYARVKQNDEVYVVAKNLVEKVFKEDYEILSTHKGSEFVGTAYEPPFDYISVKKGHIVVDADYVSDTSGTGIVHTAPAHGEDDYRTSRQHGLDFVNVVNLAGRYTDQVTDYADRFVKDCDVDIVRDLSHRNLLFSKERYEHSYPFCWRCKSPLLYYAMESWFIKTTAIKDQLIENNSKIDWYPSHLREGRFGKFLEELVDWNISRNRYWGTPLNIWLCKDCGSEYAPGSLNEIREKSVEKIDENLELHRPFVDDVKLRCSCGGTMERTPEVIDVWFDSGSMPFAQYHHPFGDEKRFHEQYPADIISEGIDQTRGWFFSLLAVSTLYNGKSPYKAVISTGHVLDENGQKMSKSKGNGIDPWEVIEEFGADAFRWALLSDSAPWSSKRFSKRIVADAKFKVIDTIHNTHAFYSLYATIDQYKPEEYPQQMVVNQLDQWVLSRLNSTLQNVEKGLETYDFMNPAKHIETFVDELSNWYIRRSRNRFWSSGMTDDKVSAYQTLHEVLLTLARMIAPYAPLIAEDIYSNLDGEGSVHLTGYPKANTVAIDKTLESDMKTAHQIVELARNIRNETGVKTRQPLSELIVSIDRPFSMSRFENIIKDEINVKEIRVEQSDSSFTTYHFKLNLKAAGKKYGKLVGPIQNHLKQLSTAETKQAVDSGFLDVTLLDETIRITLDELLVEKHGKKGFASASGYQINVALNTTITEELEQEGTVREVIRVIQDFRKKMDLPIDKRVILTLDVDAQLKEALERFNHVLQNNILLSDVRYAKEIGMETVSIGDKKFRLLIK
ncbi:isoleucine--tRNA ligase [Brevibacillus laterosporus]|uniref:Isoleucine--tRNA ligase n=1 Tax=Brevibacillus laterosporus TaxID=1465 RepID=A0AAP3DG94_BRELA|nr:isoleucine--tRNA ligase [Brevibacillus laterosporus]MCR8980764.1 isoleucine--tRNA ligase [Brevibacillus laterosporus]MCZ0807919.1 isoleucine--tRNA ligase [Brevibacillus laterosporus]MCZ0826190.1 isoleucine--tRNA ligase [Brevibacillus laterosporus]MCZ0851201.1 isoleucine--tRNA ligase [Brevibacillus laterosporus]